MTHIRVTTTTGSVHEVDTDTLTYRRHHAPSGRVATLRGDATERRLAAVPDPPAVGERWLLLLAPDGAHPTARETSRVVSVEVLSPA